MMKDKSGMYNFYTPLPEHTIIDVSTQGDHLVTVQHLKTGETRQIEGKILCSRKTFPTETESAENKFFFFFHCSLILCNFNWISTGSTTTVQHINEELQ